MGQAGTGLLGKEGNTGRGHGAFGCRGEESALPSPAFDFREVVVRPCLFLFFLAWLSCLPSPACLATEARGTDQLAPAFTSLTPEEKESKAELQEAGDLFDKEEFKAAIVHLTYAIELNPGSAPARQKRALSYMQLEDYKKAILDFTWLIKINSRDSFAYYQRGLAYFNSLEDRNALKQALREFSQAIRFNPRMTSAYCYRGLVYIHVGQLDRGLKDYDKALELDRENAFVHYLRANALASLGQRIGAVNSYLEAVKLAPHYALENIYGENLNYIDKNSFQKLIADYDTTLKLSPISVACHTGKGFAHLAMGNYNEALKSYEIALKLSPISVACHTGKGFAHLAMGNYNEALKSYEIALKLDPKYSLAYTGKGFARLKLHQAEKALGHFTRAIQLNAQYTASYMGRGDAYAALKQNGAIAEYRKVALLNPKSVSAR